MFQRLLVPFDDSQGAALACKLAAGWALSWGGAVRLVHHINVLAFPNALGYGEPVIRSATHAAQTLLARKVEWLQAQGVQTTAHLCRDAGKGLDACIADEAASWGADLVVLGSHGRKGIAHALLGSGAERIARAVPVPALVVRTSSHHRFTRILVPIDGSPTSLHALATAVQLARQAGARLRVFHSLTDLAYLGAYRVVDAAMEQARANGLAILSQAVDQAKAAGMDAESSLCTNDSRLGDAVAAEAASWNADLVVAGSHGRRGIGHLLLGSGAEQILRTSHVSVMVVPARGEPNR